MTDRNAGLRGRLPAKPTGERFALRYAHEYLAVPIQPAVYPVDVTGGITEWGMLGNDTVGDCTFAGREHNRMAKAAAGHLTETWEQSDALIAEYLAYNNGQDNGAVIADLLLAWYTAGKILAFAPVDHTDRATCDALAIAFHGLYAGVSLTDDADALFNHGQPWNVDSGQTPNPAHGHCIILVGTDGSSSDTWVSWGALQRSTRAWSAACVDEAWVIVTTEDEAALLDMPTLLADINALHGTEPAPQPPTPAPPAPPTPPEPPMPDPTPIPDPNPTPTPTPTPTPDPTPAPPAPAPPAPAPEPTPAPVPTPAPGVFPSGDPAADQARADHDLKVADDEETVAGDEQTRTDDQVKVASDDTQTAADDAKLVTDEGVVPANPPAEANPGLPTTRPADTVPPGFAAIVPDDVDEGEDLAGQVTNVNVPTPDIAQLQDGSRGTDPKDETVQ